jgi:TRAP-type mannitol/chloroaromatic compound transport system permease small subunit
MKKRLVQILNLIDRISEWIGLTVRWLVPAMVVVISFEVVARYLFGRPTIWVYDMAIFLFGYSALLGGAYALKHKNHINVDVVYMGFTDRRKAFSDVVSGLLIGFFLFLIIKYGFKSAIHALEIGERTNTEWAPPIGHFKLLIPVSAVLLFLQGLANWIRSLFLCITGKELTP